MMDPADQSSSDTLLSGGVLLLIAALLLVALVLAVAVAPLVRRLYGRRVLRLMGLNQVATRPVSTASEDATQSPGHLPRSHNGADALAALARERQQRIIRSTILAWLTFAAIAPFVAGVDPKAGLGERIGFFVLAAVFALGPALTNLPKGWTQWRLASGGTYMALWRL